MLHILALTAAFAAPTVDLPKLFDGELARIGPKTSVPILLPQTMPDEFDEYFPTGFGRERRWGLQLGAAKGCGGATACFIASFSGRKGGKPFGERRVKLGAAASGASSRLVRRVLLPARDRVEGARSDLLHLGQGGDPGDRGAGVQADGQLRHPPGPAPSYRPSSRTPSSSAPRWCASSWRTVRVTCARSLVRVVAEVAQQRVAEDDDPVRVVVARRRVALVEPVGRWRRPLSEITTGTCSSARSSRSGRSSSASRTSSSKSAGLRGRAP